MTGYSRAAQLDDFHRAVAAGLIRPRTGLPIRPPIDSYPPATPVRDDATRPLTTPQPNRPGAAAMPTNQPTAALVAQIGTVLATHAQQLADQRPWGEENPVVWAMKTGRIVQASAPGWLEKYIADPATVGPLMALLEPVAPTTARLAALASAAGVDGDDGDGGEFAEFDNLFPPHQRSDRGAAARAAEDAAFDAEFGHLFRPRRQD